ESWLCIPECHGNRCTWRLCRGRSGHYRPALHRRRPPGRRSHRTPPWPARTERFSTSLEWLLVRLKTWLGMSAGSMPSYKTLRLYDNCCRAIPTRARLPAPQLPTPPPMPAAQTSPASRFEGTERYVATDDLKLAVNAALTLQRPLLIKGEPGTGKTMLAEEVAQALGRPLLQWHIKSTTKAHQGLYEFDAVSRLRDSQLGDEKVRDIRNYIVPGTL